MGWGNYVIEDIGSGWFIVACSVSHYNDSAGGYDWTPVIYGSFRERAEAESLLAALEGAAGPSEKDAA